MAHVNTEGLTLIKNFEGLRLRSYQDSGGVWTIGYGHTPAYGGQVISQETADALLRSDISIFEHGVQNSLERAVNPNQFSALVSFAYNLGLGAFRGSTLLRCVNSGDFEQASNEFLKWANCNGVRLEGLVRRRAAERDLFRKKVG